MQSIEAERRRSLLRKLDLTRVFAHETELRIDEKKRTLLLFSNK